MSAIVVDPGRRARLSLDEYHRLIESGGLDEGARVELIDGLLVAMSLGPKAAVYARAHVSELWVVDLDGGRVLVHREPRGDGWAEVSVASAEDHVLAKAVGLPALALRELLDAAAAG